MNIKIQAYSKHQKVPNSVWIQEIPAHWEVRPNRGVFYESSQRANGNEQMLSVTIAEGVIPQAELLAETSKKDSSQLNKSMYKHVSPGDIVYNKMRAWQSAIGVSRFYGIVSPAYVVLRLIDSRCSARYFHYLFRTGFFAMEAQRHSYGITSDMWSLRPEDFKLIYVPIPSFEEQSSIAKFLDYADKKLAKKIKEKEKLLKLLAEKRRATIHHAVTHGLDSSISRKPSNIRWLGNIPSHWGVKKIGACADIIVSNVDKHSHDGELPVRLCNYTDVYKNKSITKNMNFMHATASDEEIKRFRIRIGDTIITKTSETWKDIGVPAYVEFESDNLICGYSLTILRPYSKFIDSHYLFWALHGEASAIQFSMESKGVTRYVLPYRTIKNSYIAIPPLKEQIAIAEYLGEIVGKTDAAIAATRREIELLREYRARLVSDAVTGTIDVRGFTPPAEQKNRNKKYANKS